MREIIIFTTNHKLTLMHNKHTWELYVFDYTTRKQTIQYFETLKEAFHYIDVHYNEGIERLC